MGYFRRSLAFAAVVMSLYIVWTLYASPPHHPTPEYFILRGLELAMFTLSAFAGALVGFALLPRSLLLPHMTIVVLGFLNAAACFVIAKPLVDRVGILWTVLAFICVSLVVVQLIGRAVSRRGA
jgi:peptidoglycan/LPS O-acetylase OafA/YrhL